VPWGFYGLSRDDQPAMAGVLRRLPSLIWLIVSSVICRARWTAYSPFRSSMMALSFGKMFAFLRRMTCSRKRAASFADPRSPLTGIDGHPINRIAERLPWD
jgi:hypothetical protein